MIRRPPRSTQSRSSAASDVYKRQTQVIAAGTNRVEHGRRLLHEIAVAAHEPHAIACTDLPARAGNRDFEKTHATRPDASGERGKAVRIAGAGTDQDRRA